MSPILVRSVPKCLSATGRGAGPKFIIFWLRFAASAIHARPTDPLSPLSEGLRKHYVGFQQSRKNER